MFVWRANENLPVRRTFLSALRRLLRCTATTLRCDYRIPSLPATQRPSERTQSGSPLKCARRRNNDHHARSRCWFYTKMTYKDIKRSVVHSLFVCPVRYFLWLSFSLQKYRWEKRRATANIIHNYSNCVIGQPSYINKNMAVNLSERYSFVFVWSNYI